MTATRSGPRLPLLERLGRDGHGAPLDADGLRASVGRELVRLLNTRTGAAPAGRRLSVVDYGLPDWSSSYGADAEDRQRLARAIERAVRAFEPRLRDPQATVEPHPAGLRQLHVVLAGRLSADNAAGDVRYGLGLDNAGAVLFGVEVPP